MTNFKRSMKSKSIITSFSLKLIEINDLVSCGFKKYLKFGSIISYFPQEDIFYFSRLRLKYDNYSNPDPCPSIVICKVTSTG